MLRIRRLGVRLPSRRYRGKRSTPDGVIRTGLVEEPQVVQLRPTPTPRLVRVLYPNAQQGNEESHPETTSQVRWPLEGSRSNHP